MNDLISIIVPVYNVEQYLDRCIESIINQTYTNLEIILVDDGSPDNCPDMCDKWAEKDNRIKVIHQANMGAGAARNAGLDNANGKYIGFIDSDDYISKEMYEHLYSLMTPDIDIVECEYALVYNDYELIYEKNFSSSIYSVKDAFEEHIKEHYFKQLIWNKLYKKHILNNVRFPTNSKIDDEFFTYKVIGNANYLLHSDKICYAYRQNNNSIMHTINLNNLIQSIDAKILRHKYVILNFPDLQETSLTSLLYYCIFIGQKALYVKNSKEKKIIIKKLNDIIKKYPIKKIKLNKQNIWLIISRFSLKFACIIRNLLKIGI